MQVPYRVTRSQPKVNHRLRSVLLLGLILFATVVLPWSARAVERIEKNPVRAKVTAEDCRKCHADITFTVQRRGGAHSTLCLDCHRGHPPADMEIIPSCGECHSGDSPHFRLQGCLVCHGNPHVPLDIALTRNITTPCLSCHEQQNKDLQKFPSIHSKLACTACHNFHGQIQPCGNCHAPHSDTMAADSCGLCHQAHKPLVITYGEGVSSEDCGSCHTDIYDMMADNATRHRKVACSTCHTDHHGMIPACTVCHDHPHPREILARFSDCSECHGIAHRLESTKAVTSTFMRGR